MNLAEQRIVDVAMLLGTRVFGYLVGAFPIQMFWVSRCIIDQCKPAIKGNFGYSVLGIPKLRDVYNLKKP